MLPPAAGDAETIVDLGCGTGVAAAAWAINCRRTPAVIGIDRNAWALGEARQTYKAFGLKARVRHESVAPTSMTAPPTAVVAAFTMNELDDTLRDRVLERLLTRGRGHVLIVEPLAGNAARWWPRWRDRFEAAGGRADEWRLRPELPTIVAKLDRAAGLNHREITGRSLWKSA